MENEPRKASDILLDLENKINSMLKIIQSQNLVINVISNKLNSLMEKTDTDKAQASLPNLPIQNYYASDNSKKDIGNNVLVLPEDSLPLETSPQGFRRTSRPETYSGDNSYLNKMPVQPKTIVQIPKMPTNNEVIVPAANKVPVAPVNQQPQQPKQMDMHNAVSVSQRVVDRNSKSVFLADVEIIDLSTNNNVYKTRTTGIGKWMASLAPGSYRVFVRKREALTKEKIEVIQDITIDGSVSNIELKMMIIK